MKKKETNNKILEKLNNLINGNNDNKKENEENEEEEGLGTSEHIKLNLKKEDSFKSMFSVISLEQDDKNNVENNKKRNSNMTNMSEYSINDNNKTLSFWEMIKLKFNDIKNHILFNYNIFSSPNNLVNISQNLNKQIQIFDTKYSNQEDLLNRLKNIPWFSYRENFEQIKDEQNIYTSDAGWGCMLRASQMILAQGLYRLNNLNNLVEFINRFFAFFYDNKIPIKFMCKPKKPESEEDKNKKKDNSKKETNIFNSFEIIDKENELFNMSFINLTSEMVEGLENMSERNSDKEYIIPPYSIRNFIKVQKHTNKNGKQLGEWFSNYDSIRLISTINKKMNSNKDCDFKILNFKEGVITINDIIKECFEECIEVIQETDFDILSLSNIEFSDDVNEDLKSNKYIINDKKYKFKTKFILFVSVRHGLYNLEEDYYNEVLKVFDIENNIGIIGGKNTRAFYFIGKCGSNIIFLDPHYVQETLPLIKIGTDVVHESYIPNDIFYMDVNELSPSFSIGFAVKDMKSFKQLVKKFRENNYFIDDEKCKKKNINNLYLFEVKNN